MSVTNAEMMKACQQAANVLCGTTEQTQHVMQMISAYYDGENDSCLKKRVDNPKRT